MKIPSVKTLTESGLCADEAQATRLREVLRRGRPFVVDNAEFPVTNAWIRSCYHWPNAGAVKMEAANELLGMHGVEAVHADDDGMYGQGSVAFEYLNSGDTYTVTLIRRRAGVYAAGCMGDEVERMERRGVAVK